MPRRSKSRRSERNLRRSRRTAARSRRVVQKQPTNVERRSAAAQAIRRRAIRRSRDDVESSSKRRDLRKAGLLDRRVVMQESKKPAGRRLSLAPLPVAKRNANAQRETMLATPCARKKTARRAVIIAMGYGGKNGFRNYKEQRKCR